MTNKEIIIRLIKDHLVQTRLINGLENLGLCPDNYYLHLSDTIFKMIGINDENEELYEVYLNWCTKMSQTEVFSDQKLLEEYATEIYAILLEESAFMKDTANSTKK
jgi:hypothetical protein